MCIERNIFADINVKIHISNIICILNSLLEKICLDELENGAYETPDTNQIKNV